MAKVVRLVHKRLEIRHVNGKDPVVAETEPNQNEQVQNEVGEVGALGVVTVVVSGLMRCRRAVVVVAAAHSVVAVVEVTCAFTFRRRHRRSSEFVPD